MVIRETLNKLQKNVIFGIVAGALSADTRYHSETQR